ncbi:MAG: terpene cyclase/mutase family protein [Bacteroidia bacterium]|nr:terpene cyclase/mutase family protein [Bacteroidia bacterium]
MKKLVYFLALSLGLFSLTFSQEPGKEKLQLSINNGVLFLKNIQRSDGAICDTTNSLFDVWETIMAATAIYDLTNDTNDVTFKKAITFVRLNQNNKGLICHNQKCKKEYCLETSAVYFLLLIKMGHLKTVKARLKLIDTLQNKLGYWEIGNPDVTEKKDFPSVTGFVLSVYKAAGVTPPNEKKAYSWLLSKQNAEGNWGKAWEYYNCPAYATWAITSCLSKDPAQQKALQKMNDHFLATQKKDGSWFYADTLFDKGPSSELQTAFCAKSIDRSLKNDTAINKAIKFLYNAQKKDGAWDGGSFPIKNKRYSKREYVLSTALSLIVINDFIHKK